MKATLGLFHLKVNVKETAKKDLEHQYKMKGATVNAINIVSRTPRYVNSLSFQEIYSVKFIF